MKSVIMSEHFNKLTPAQAEALAILMEECGEVIQAAGKILRHGVISSYSGHRSNQTALIEEMGDVVIAIGLLQREFCSQGSVFVALRNKLADTTRNQYLHHVGKLDLASVMYALSP